MIAAGPVIRLVRKAFIGFPNQTALGRFHCGRTQ
jgi:hypothetical protein